MLKDATYKEKFQLLNPWMPKIIDSVKKDLKQDHLQKDWQFVKAHFPGKNPQKLTPEELAPAYLQVLSEGESEELGEYIANRWLLKNSEIYHYFEEQLRQLHPDFNEIEELDKNVSHKLMEDSIRQFGALKTYIFSVLNSVVFPSEIYKQLDVLSAQSQQQEEMTAKVNEERMTLESLQRAQEREIARVTDKYEKKLLGLQKKYLQDTESLKKQIAALQRKFTPKAVG